MSGEDHPKLSLGQPPGVLKTRTGPIAKGWLWAFLGLHVVILVCLVALLRRPAGPARSAPAAPASADARELREAARQLEDKGLDAQAAQAWEAYLEAEPETPERAEILYRVGKLYMQAEQFGEAAAALVRSEVAAGEDQPLSEKIGPRLIKCLRRLGLYGEVGRELSRRVEVGAKPLGKGRVLATLAGEQLTEADLDRMIRRRVDQMLAVRGMTGDEGARQAVLKQLSRPEARRQMLQELLQTELFCRRARELNLDREEDFLQARRHLEENLLANRFLARQLEKIRPTDVDLQSYYKANLDRYREPESGEVRWIRLGLEEDAAELLAAIKSADDFRKLAAERQPSEAPGGGPPPPRRIVRGELDRLLGDPEPLFKLSEGEWTKGPLLSDDQKYLVLVEKKSPARVLPLAEVRPRVEVDYTQAKQQEWTQELFRDLLTRYDVRIMPPDDQREEKTPPDKDASKPDDHAAEAAKEKTP